LCAEEAAAQEQTGQVEECLKVNLLKIKTEMCKKVKEMWRMSSERHLIPALVGVLKYFCRSQPEPCYGQHGASVY